MRIRKRIEQLQQYRLNGVRSLADGDQFDLERRKRVRTLPLASAHLYLVTVQDSQAGGRKRELAYLNKKRSLDEAGSPPPSPSLSLLTQSSRGLLLRFVARWTARV